MNHPLPAMHAKNKNAIFTYLQSNFVGCFWLSRSINPKGPDFILTAANPIAVYMPYGISDVTLSYMDDLRAMGWRCIVAGTVETIKKQLEVLR